MRPGRAQTPAARASLLPALLRAAGGCGALWLGAQTLAVAAGDDPREWLERTDQALSNRNYEGVFVHEHAGESETLRVIHRVDSDGVAERLLSMDGSGREFIRKGTQLICYLPDQRTVLVERSPDSALLLSGLPRIDVTSAGQYQVKELARARVSGRDARVIAITPMDQLRYGYRIWVDESTAMPLKTQLRDSHGGVLEQIVFTSLDMPAHIPKAELESGIDAHAYRWVRRDAEPVDVGSLSVSWEANALPPGFRMTASARQMLPAGAVEHLVFSDGLASVSVFVEISRPGGGAPDKDDAATLGTSSAFSTMLQGYRVTAVGEVPPETVRAIAQSIRSGGPGNASPALVQDLGSGSVSGPGTGPGPRPGPGPGPGPRASAGNALDAGDGATPSIFNGPVSRGGLGGFAAPSGPPAGAPARR
jgi:sigma-E factor negative regulatory protein RseB